MYGAKISSIRHLRGHTQDYVAQKLGIHQNVYSKIERDEKIKMSDDLLEKIAGILGVSKDDIKSGSPIVMKFHDVPDASQNQKMNVNESIVAHLAEQLRIKDLRISQLLEQNLQLSLLLGKLKDKSR